MIVLVPLELTEYDYEYNNDPRQYAARGRTGLAHRRGYSGRRLLTQVSPGSSCFYFYHYSHLQLHLHGIHLGYQLSLIRSHL